VVRTFKYRLRPTLEQHESLAKILDGQRALYNAALEHRIGGYRRGVTVTLFAQTKELTELRAENDYSAVPVALQRWTLRRLDNAYKGFFSRLTRGGRAGFPRFRSRARWDSFGFSEWKGISSTDDGLRFSGLPGSLRIHVHRRLPNGKPLCCTFTQDHKGWYVCLQYRLSVKALSSNAREIGIDMGLRELCVLSTGEAIPNARVARKAEKELRRRQRSLARCKQGSKRRQKVKAQVTRCHARIKNTRRTYLHQVSARLIREYGHIAIENLNVKGLARSRLAKSIHDAGWATLRQMLEYKAESAGVTVVAVDPKRTSQVCSGCGSIVLKPLSQRTHSCLDCGLVLDRDHNAAINILARGRTGSQASQREATACA
jgi:putative transposase